MIMSNNKLRSLSCLLLIIDFFLIPREQIFGQEKVFVSTGLGLPELLNVGIKYQISEQSKIGLSAGWWPSYSGTNISFSGDYYYHFGGSSEFSELRPWYGRVGLNWIPNWWVDSYLRIGRDIYVSRSLGISLDAGLMYNFSKNSLPVIITYGGCLFYRF